MGTALTTVNLKAVKARAEMHLGVHCVNVYVRDQERSLQFYVEQLGFRVAFDAKLQSGERWVAVSPPDGSAVLALIKPKPKSQEAKLIGRSTQIVFLTDDVAARFQEWSKRGVRFSSAPRLRRIKFDPETQARAAKQSLLLGVEAPIWGNAITHFRDVDGNSFTLTSYDEVTHAMEAQRLAALQRQEAERRAARELEIAWEVQARLFPQSLPPMATLEYAGMCMQARQVGGDYYDFLDLGQERLGLVLSDIAGKGIAGALLMANLQANLRSQCAIAIDQPQAFLRSVNRLFFENTTDGAYATLFFGEYDERQRRLRYVNCGHLPALLLRGSGEIERLEATSTVLGLFDRWDCDMEERQLAPGDTLVIYTDGVTESFHEHEEQFGEERLIAALQRNAERSSREIIAAVVKEVQAFSANEQQDDITLIAAKCREGSH
ncbi:MAG: SpoIIE family protein phosphatase [Acidobacteria bacterium]|nr:SpoIIE family protein phosphatase [Acidobacteriota bacterium]MBS1867267.1 SpoIIE family protein phosphatase [Acidobacteriota bacterium]